MPIDSTLGRLVAAEEALRRLAEQRMPLKTAYHIAKLAKLLSAESEIFQQKKTEIFRAHGTERPPKTEEERAQFGETVLEVPPASRQVVFDAMKELFEVPVRIEWAPLTLAQLDGVSISPLDLIALDPVVEGDPA